jgi:signal transduction histidine kinase/ABC-type amino acid transport substrate-binding protein
MLKYHLRPKRILYFVFVLIVLATLFFNRSHQLQTGKSFFQRTRVEAFTDEEVHWLMAKGSLKAAVLKDNEPLSGLSSEGLLDGVDVMYLHHLETELGIPIELIPMGRKEQITALKQGQIDLIVAAPLMKHKEVLRYSLPLYEVRNIAVTASSEPINRVGDLADQRIVYLHEDYAQEFFYQKRIGHQGVELYRVEDGLEAVRAGAANVLIGPEPLVLKALNELNREDREIFHIASLPIFNKEYSLAVPSDNAVLFSLVNKAVHNLEQAGTMNRIQQMFFGMSAPLVQEPLEERYFTILVIFGLSLSMIFYLFYSSNFSLRMEIEEKMKELDYSRQELQNAFDGIEHIIMVLDNDYRTRLLNQFALRWFDKPASQLVGKTLDEIMDRPIYDKIFSVVEDSFSERVSFKRIFQHEKWIYELGAAPLEYRNDSVSKMLLTLKDVTEEYQQEQLLLQKNKMASIGQLAAGIAHEIRNPLGVIRNYMFLLKNRLKGVEPEFTYAETIDQIAQKANAILNNLLDVSRTESGQWKTVSVRNSIVRIVELQQSTLKDKTIEIEVIGDENLEMSLPLDVIDTTLVNLISNARDAIEDHGRIEIRFEKKSDFLDLQISDDGTGMNEDVKRTFLIRFSPQSRREKGLGLD